MRLHLELLSATTPGRGDGVAGFIDIEVEHDGITGLPYLRGRTLKGLLVEQCSDILWSLQQCAPGSVARMYPAAQALFGRPGSARGDAATLHIGPAVLSTDVREAVRVEIEENRLTPEAVLQTLTAIRRQSAVDDETGAPARETLRSMRVILRGLEFSAPLRFDADPTDEQHALLAACTLGLRGLGMGRNRGRGRVRAWLSDEDSQDVMPTLFRRFSDLISGTEGAE